MQTDELINTTDRVRKNLSEKSNVKVENEIIDTIEAYKFKSPQEIQQRIMELEEEWSIERRIETFASTLIC